MTSLCLPTSDSLAVDIFLRNGQLWDGENQPPAPSPDTRPVLFVHGHSLKHCTPSMPNCAHYLKTWVKTLANGLPSFDQAIGRNYWPDLEPYYLNFWDHERSIIEDARAIGEAVDRIVMHHNPGSTLAEIQVKVPSVQVSIIAYSKGTMSSRLYLKSLQQPQYDLPGPYPDYWPVSEFIAIAPPNHGLAAWPQPGAASSLRG